MFYVLMPNGVIPPFYGPFPSYKGAEECAMLYCSSPTLKLTILGTVATVEANGKMTKAIRKA